MSCIFTGIIHIPSRVAKQPCVINHSNMLKKHKLHSNKNSINCKNNNVSRVGLILILVLSTRMTNRHTITNTLYEK